MRTKLFIATLFAFISLGANAQVKKSKKDTLNKNYPSIHNNSKKKVTGNGPYKVNPKTLKKNTDHKENKNNYHNEQDNFKRPDSIPYHKAPSKNDTSDHSYNYNTEELPYSKSAQTNPSVTFGFDAEYCSVNNPPDNSMAISDGGYVVSAVNCGIVFYNSSGQVVGGPYDYFTWFNITPTSTNFSDPRVVYDVYNDRFIFFIQYGCDANTSLIYVAFSTSNDPTQPWNWYSFNVGTSGGLIPGSWFDYPSVGINQTDFCISGNLFTGSGCANTAVGAGNLVLLFNKQDGYNGVSLANFHYIGFQNMLDGTSNKGFSIIPATAGQNISYNNIFYLVSTVAGGGNYVTKYTINGNSTNAGSTYSSVNINTLQPYSLVASAAQPSGNSLSIKAGCRAQSAVYLNGTIMFVYTGDYVSGGNNYSSVYYHQLNVSGNTLIESQSYLGGSNYAYPSVGSFGINQTDLAGILCFLKSDASTNPEVRFKYFDNNMNPLSSSQVRIGDASVNYTVTVPPQRWGDYTATQRKYNASQPEMWIAGSYGNTSNYWQTHIAQINGYPGSVGVSQVNLNDLKLNVYPNPVTSQLYIKGDLKNIYGFPELYSSDGKLLTIDVTRKGNEMFQVDVSRLSKGTYFIKFNNATAINFIKE